MLIVIQTYLKSFGVSKYSHRNFDKLNGNCESVSQLTDYLFTTGLGKNMIQHVHLILHLEPLTS